MTAAETLLLEAVLAFTEQGKLPMDFQSLERIYVWARAVREERGLQVGAATNKPGAASPGLHLRSSR